MSETDLNEKTTDYNEFNRQLIEEFRANGGKVSGMFAGAPLLLLTTTGAKSGQPRVAPLAYTTDNGRLVVIASKGGAPTHPDWFHNLRANPEVTVEFGNGDLSRARHDRQGSRTAATLRPDGGADAELRGVPAQHDAPAPSHRARARRLGPIAAFRRGKTAPAGDRPLRRSRRGRSRHGPRGFADARRVQR